MATVSPEPEVDVDYSYDAFGRQISASVPHTTTVGWVNRAPEWSAYTSTNYDALGRVNAVAAPNGETTDYQYINRQTKVMGLGRNGYPNKVLKWTEVDGLGRLFRIRTGNQYGAETESVTLNYDVLDNLVQVVQPVGTTTMTYDLAGRKTRMVDLDLGTWTYSYYRNGQLRTQTDACGNVTTQMYDSVGRITARGVQPNSGSGKSCDLSLAQRTTVTTTFQYDTNHSQWARTRGQVTAISAGDGSFTKYFGYNAKGQLAGETVYIAGAPQSYTTQYGYDAYDRLSTKTYPDGDVVKTDYNGMGLAVGITSTIGTSVANIVNYASYDAAGRLTQMNYRYGGGIWVNYRYAPWLGSTGDSNGRLLGIYAGATPGSASVFSAWYVYDTFGNPYAHSVYRNDGNTLVDYSAFYYDDHNRMIGEYQGVVGTTRDYGWQTGGRMRYFGTSVFTYDGNHPHAADTMGEVNRYDYDANGNVILRRNSAGTVQALKWDGSNRLALVTSSTVNESYLYDESGRRIRKTSNGVTTFYPTADFEQTGAVIGKYYSFAGQVVAERDNSGVAYLYHNAVGSTIHVTNQYGNYQAGRGYYAYGETRRTDGVMPTDRRYTGQQESATGLYYYGARWYDPTIGQFLSPDTLVPDASNFLDYNRYLYARGNPLVNNDPSGHCPTAAPNNEDQDAITEYNECWQMAWTIWAQWDNTGYWQRMWPEGKDHFIKNVATQPINANVFKNWFAAYLNSEDYRSWYKAQAVSETTASPAKDNDTGAIGIGLSYIVSSPPIDILFGIGGGGGIELVKSDKEEWGLFSYGGGGGSIGRAGNFRLYLIKVQGIETLRDYEGLTASAELTAGIAPVGGIAYSEFVSANGKVHGKTLGYARGDPFLASIALNGNYYFQLYSWK